MSATPPETGTRPPDAVGGVLARSDEGRMLTGVCAGLGRYAGIDPVLVRVGMAVLVLGSGIGFFLYIAAFLLMRSPDGGPGYVEQWTNRVIDAQAVLALLTAVLGFGLVMNLFADSTGPGTIVVGTMIAIALLAARSRGVDLVAVARSLPERLSYRRRRGQTPVGRPYPFHDPAYGSRGRETAATEAPVAEPPVPEPPVAEPPIAEPPVAEPPVAEAPVPEAPAAEPPIAEPPLPEPPAAEPPVAGPPIAEPPVAGPPIAEPPVAGPSVAESPAHEPPVVPPEPATQETPIARPSAPPRPDDGFRRLKDLAAEARTSAYAWKEAFAPHGPYNPPTRYAEQDPYGYDMGGYGGAPVATTAPRKRPRSFVGPVTLLIAMLVGGIMVASQPSGSAVNLPVVGGAVLITIGAGLLVTAWFGRGIGLIAAGTIVALALIAGGTLHGVSNRVGSYTWAPATTTEALADRYEVGIGDATLDLTQTEAAPGSRTRLNVTIAVGTLEVIVPPTARVEVDAEVRVGDITVGRSTRGGTGLSLHTVLEPVNAGGAQAPVYELHLKGGMGDVEVRHG